MIRPGIWLICALAAPWLMLAAAGEEADAGADEPVEIEERDERVWFVMFGNTNNHPALRDASRTIDRQLNLPFRLIAPGFDDIRTFKDQADDFGIWSPMVGIGRNLNEYWDVFLQVGYSRWTIPTRQTNVSIFLLPLHTDIQLTRSNFFVGGGATYFPWRMPELRSYDTIGERLRNSKPYAGVFVLYNHLTFDARIRARPLPLPRIVNREESGRWNDVSIGAQLGVETPLTERTTVSFNVQYNYFVNNHRDFSGPGLGSLVKWRF